MTVHVTSDLQWIKACDMYIMYVLYSLEYLRSFTPKYNSLQIWLTKGNYTVLPPLMIIPLNSSEGVYKSGFPAVALILF